MKRNGAPMDMIDQRIADRLADLRAEKGWSLDELARRCDVSRASLSRLENAEVSPTANVLGKLCAAYGLTLSRLMQMVEDEFSPAIFRDIQREWVDPETGYKRRSVSPPARGLAGEVLDCEIPPGTRIEYAASPRQGLEHHLVMLAGELRVTVDDEIYDLEPGDCLRYQLCGPNCFETPAECGAHYHLFIV
ncbi:XRE family transcriptional regulator [Thalassospira alkalitolerans]|uniref:XRE family transcriptional regulator n=2 Tax=Thalassospira alkalitolerans TaxID=1293890 RepID=A0A1Y2L5K9_9PROT|nr:XRE family transcriptional regulator [Thalassospira alkalitolerans]